MNLDGTGTVALAAIVAALALFASRCPVLLSGPLARLEHHSHRRVLVIVATAILPVVIRLLVVPWFGVPVPRVADEFNHLLVADTLASGHLANVTHPLWRHFETAYVLQLPAYASAYPIGQGAVIAIGEFLTGHPWGGVLLSVALMSGGITWMLYGCLPAGWAVVGGLIAAVQFGLASQWVSSYWGGAFCAFGGALVCGALVRLADASARGMAITAGAGWSIVWLIRPYESLLLFAFVWLAFVVVIHRQRWPRRTWIAAVLLLASVQLLAGLVTVLHNRAVTGSFLTLPYRLHQRVYGTPQTFLRQPPIDSPDFRVPELKSLYDWQRNQKEDLDEHPIRQFTRVLRDFWNFYVTAWYSAPAILMLSLLGDARVRVAVGLVAAALAVSAMYPFFLLHYVAAYTAVVVFLIVRGLNALSGWSIGRFAVGWGLAVFLIIGSVLSVLPLVPITNALSITSTGVEPPWLREQLAQRLTALGGRHVVFVQYDPGHNFHDEWVFNGANVDDAPIVWSRTIGAAEDGDVVRYYNGRSLWRVVVDDNGARVYRHGPDGEDDVPAFTIGS
jgi:hypothetical protein